MRAGTLDRKVVILKAGPVTDAHGDQVDGFTALDPVSASKRPAPGAERLSSAENAANAPMVFRIRWRASFDPETAGGINPKDRLQHPPETGKIYDIVSAIEIGRREGIEIAAVARADR
ncbi:MAG: head-tail adaptor protein [Pseudomonadota bacterium]